ncbi:MAG: YceI family protein [Chitinophagales bacterium]|nr:YceI family protein [Chitinophagales bacterium]
MSKWSIDPTHSDIHFKVKHLMINTVTGSFKKFDASLETSKLDLTDAKISFTADIDSINTGLEMRDTHLKSDDFFNAEKYPQLKFESTGFEKIGDSSYLLKGNLTIRETTKPVQLDVEYGGQMADFYGNTKAGFEITGKLKRKEFGLNWDAVTEAGGVVVSDEIKLVLNVQMQLQK